MAHETRTSRLLGEILGDALREMQLGDDTAAMLTVRRERYARDCISDGCEADCLRSYDSLLSLCESPIEQLFVATMVDQGWHRSLFSGGLHMLDLENVVDVVDDDRVLFFPGNGCAILQPTLHLSRYQDARVDLLFAGSRRTVVVELDGHDFHERTPEQARNDKSRDRAMLDLDLPVMRFTGSEVYRRPLGCLGEVMRAVIGGPETGF